MRSEIFRPSPPPKNEDDTSTTNEEGNNIIMMDVNSNDDNETMSSHEKSDEEQQQQTLAAHRQDGCGWERVDKEQHPLGDDYHHHNEDDDPFPFRPTPIDTAMLLQSAARSVLDISASSTTSTPNNASPLAANNHPNHNENMNNINDIDDDKSSLWMMDNHHIITRTQRNRDDHHHVSSLHSLETKTLAAMPDFQDRRRFLGCLAAVLASSYDYDTLDEEYDDIHQVTRAETILFHHENDNAKEEEVEGEEILLEEDEETESETIDDDDFSDDNDGDDDEHRSLLQQTVSGSFEFSDVGDSSYAATQRGGGARQPPPPRRSSSSSLSSAAKPRWSPPRNKAATTTTSSKQHPSPPRQQQQSQERMLFRHAHKMRLSRSRHLKRRYDVLTRLLLSSADYLMLEKSQAKAFVPLLAKLLVPKQKSVALPDGKKQKQKQQYADSMKNINNTVPSTPTNSCTASSTTCITTATMTNVENGTTTEGGGAQKPTLLKKSSVSPSGTIATVSSATTATIATTATTMNMANNNVDESSQQQRRRQKQALLLENLLLSPESAARQSVMNNDCNNFKNAASDSVPPTTTKATTTMTHIDSTDNFIPKENEVIILQKEISEIENLQPFLESMTRGGAFRCLVLVLLQHLLTSSEGYDARIRHALKTLGVIILVQDIMETAMDAESSTLSSQSRQQRGSRHGNYENLADRTPADVTPDLVELATRRFESLEHWIAANLIDLSREQEKAHQLVRGRRSTGSAGNQASSSSFNKNSTTTDNVMIVSRREQIIRGVKVGAVGLAAASLFAVTAGLAAPAIATAAAALAGGTAATAAAAAVLTSTPAVISIFGVGGGTLVAYKMNRRTMGLTEFVFRKENARSTSRGKGNTTDTPKQQQQPMEAELFSTICISGWLRDECDFQRPWGVTPSDPWITNQEELLQRFYTVHRPDHVTKCKKILKSWEGEEMELWNLLRQKYGRDPDTLFPLEEGPRFGGSLTLEQKEVVDRLFVELGCTIRGTTNTEPNRQQEKQTQQIPAPTPFGRMRVGWKRRGRQAGPTTDNVLNASQMDQHSGSTGNRIYDSLHGPVTRDPSSVPASLLVADGSSVASSGFESKTISLPSDNALDDEQQNVQSKDGAGSSSSIPKHLATVWDYQANYGGELYTVRWESRLLTELCDSVSDLALELVTGGTAQILKHTALSTLLSAIALPYALVNAANMIDETWTLAVERSDEAGRELARSLLFSRAGHRPVTLVGFSFGARTIYSCLKELAKYQEKWTEYRERTHMDNHDAATPAASWSYSTNTPNDDIEGSDDFYKHMREPASIVEDAVLMGLPNHLSLSSWRACRQVVSGRLVNCFSQKDLILSLMFQYKRMSLGFKPVCGTCSVAIPGVENIDVSDLVSGHVDYCMVTGDILKRLRFEQPFRSHPTKAVVPDPSPQDEVVKLEDKFDV